MTYKELIRTLEIFASHDGGIDEYCGSMYAEHDEHGIDTQHPEDFTIEEIRELISMGWGLGSDAEYDETEMWAWDNPNTATDEELKELFVLYHGVFKFE